MIKNAPASSIADLNQQSKKNGDSPVQMNGNNTNNNQQELIQKVASHCGCPLDISRKALEAHNWSPQNAVTAIEALKNRNAQQ